MNPGAWEKFNRHFWTGYNGDDGEGSITIVWTDKLGVYETKTKVVEFELSTRGTHEQYEGYRVTIIHKTNGQLTSHYFKFDDYLDERQDNRQHDYPNTDDRQGGFYVRHNSQYKRRKELEVWWYIAVPTFDAIIGMQTAITGWLESYLP